MTCDDLLKQMNEYVDDNVAPGVCDELREHLKGCESCRVVVDNIRNSITLYRNGREIDLPPECQQRLRGLLREKWSGKFKPTSR